VDGWPIFRFAWDQHERGCPILAFSARVGTTDLDFWRLADKLRSVLPTLSHKTRWGTLSRNATGKKAAFKGW